MTPIDLQIVRLRKRVLDEARHLDQIAATAISHGDQLIAEKLCQKAECLRLVEPRLDALRSASTAPCETGQSKHPDREEIGLHEVYLIALSDLSRLETSGRSNPEQTSIMRRVVAKVRTLYSLTLQFS